MPTLRQLDIEMLARILRPYNAPELSAREEQMAREMFSALGTHEYERLTVKQRSWATEIDARLRPLDILKVPKGRPVQVPAVLRAPLPLKPPGK